jgi:endoribonuclease LACTB2
LGFAGEIITTPGHSDDSVSLILDDGNAFVGDLTFPGFATDEDRALVMSSWQKIGELHARHIYSGHSPLPPDDMPA